MSKRASKIKVVTIGDLERGKAACDCGKPAKAPHTKPIRLKLGKLDGLRPPTLGFGKHCVVSPEGDVVRCFRKKATANKVARGFGPGFRVKTG